LGHCDYEDLYGRIEEYEDWANKLAMQSESNSGEEFQELQDARPCPLLEMSDHLCIADLADLNSTKNEQEALPPRPLMMVNIVNVRTDGDSRLPGEHGERGERKNG